MKILIITNSDHCGNTRKLAYAMASVTDAIVTDVAHARDYTFKEFDIIGFGSGIYAGRHDKALIELTKGVCDKKAYAFVFSTSGMGIEKYNQELINILEEKNKVVLGSFACKGLNKFAFLKYFGGMNKGCPTDTDLENAKSFIKTVVSKYEEAASNE